MKKIEEKELKILLERWFQAAKWTKEDYYRQNPVANLIIKALTKIGRYKRPKINKDGLEIKHPMYYKALGKEVPKLEDYQLNNLEEARLLELLVIWFEVVDWGNNRFLHRNNIASLIRWKMNLVDRWRALPRGNPKKGYLKSHFQDRVEY